MGALQPPITKISSRVFLEILAGLPPKKLFFSPSALVRLRHAQAASRDRSCALPRAFH